MTKSQNTQDQILAQNIVEDLPDMIFVKDAKNLKFIRVNKAAENLLGLTRQEMYGKNDYDFFSDEEADFFTTKDREVLQRGEVVDIPEEHINTANGPRWLHTRKVPIFDDNDEPIFLLGISTDITERKRVEQALEEARKKIQQWENQALREQLQEAKRMESLGVLAGGIAHDFNNLLVSMLGNADLILKSLPNDSLLRPSLENIELAAERATELTRQMLAYSGRGQVQLGPLDLLDVVNDTISLLGHGEPIRPQIEIDTFENSLVYADSTQIRQLCMNIVLNAVDAVSDKADGKLQIDISTISREQATTFAGLLELKPTDCEFVKFTVTDNGQGMDDDTQDRMFDPFFTTKEKGHGLGLAAALGIIRGHKGNVRVESTLGQGTIISVLLPAGLNAHIDEPSAKSALSEDDLHRHVLIVDDEHFVRNFVATALPKNNFTVYLAEHGQQAIDILNANKDIIDVVLLDLSMPEMSGEDVFGRLKSIRPDISIILSSGYAEADIEQRLGHHRPSAFLQKPYRSETLIVLIRDVLLSKTGS